MAERLTHAARVPVEKLVPEVKDVHVRPLLEESGEHQARRRHHLLEEGLHVMAGRQALQEVVAPDREVHGVSVRGIDGVHERLRLSPGPIAGRRPWDGVARSIDAVWCKRILKLFEAKPRPAVAKGEEVPWACRGGRRGGEKRADHRCPSRGSERRALPGVIAFGGGFQRTTRAASPRPPRAAHRPAAARGVLHLGCAVYSDA